MSTLLCPEVPNVSLAEEDLRMVYKLDPITDSRWERFVARHPHASVFHSPSWLRALSQTYGYKAVAYTLSSPPEELSNGIVVCHVESWLTGRRLVSLPFSDHCTPLVGTQRELEHLVAGLESELRKCNYRYIELRSLVPLSVNTSLEHSTVDYSFHQIDLRPDMEKIFGAFHKNSIQRKIRRAERECLSYEEGSSDEMLDEFYRLFVMTRRRHKLPPQPRKWFQNLMECFGDTLRIRIARKGTRAVAAIITLRHKNSMVYKYGASDVQFNRFGGTHMLFWRSIQEAKTCGLKLFDLGRTDAGQDGLITFKGRWGAAPSVLSYSRYSVADDATHIFDLPTSKLKEVAVKHVFSLFRPRALAILGRILYKHIG